MGALCSVAAFTGLVLLWRGRTGLLEAMLILPVGFATGVAHSATFIGLSAGVDSEDIAIAGSGLYLSSNVGMVAGVSFSNAVYQMSLRGGLQSALADVPHRETVSCHFQRNPRGIVRLTLMIDHQKGVDRHHLRSEFEGSPASGNFASVPHKLPKCL